MLKKLKSDIFFLVGFLLGGALIVTAAFTYRYLSERDFFRTIKQYKEDGETKTVSRLTAHYVYDRVLEKVKLKMRKRQYKMVKDVVPPVLQGWKIFAATSLDRIFQDGRTLVKPVYSDSVSISAAKNEYESFQIVVKNGPELLPSVWLDISEMMDEKTNAKIAKKDILWRVVGYVETDTPGYFVKYVGMWPDPLLPAQKIDISPSVTQPFWVTVHVPQDVAAGHYRGVIRVMSGDQSIGNLPVSVEVYDFTLSLESHLKTAFDYYPEETGLRYPKSDNENSEEYGLRLAGLHDKYYVDMLQHRISPILNIDPTSDGGMLAIERYRPLGLNNFSIGRFGGSFNNNWPRSDEELENLVPLYQTYAETLTMSNLLPYHYIYTWDEGKIGDPIVSKVCAMIHKADPGLKNMVCYHGIWNPEKYPGWGKDIDIWCVQIDSFDEERINTIKNLGMEIWMYASGPSSTGAPSLAIDFDSMDSRIIPWLCWKYDIKGFLYWCVNWWKFVDPFVSAQNTRWEQNGAGLLYYPGKDGPIDSLRLEIFRDGMEDYEYLYLLKTLVGDAKKKKSAPGVQDLIVRAEKLLSIDDSIATSMWSFTKDTRALLERRQQIADTIENLIKTLNE